MDTEASRNASVIERAVSMVCSRLAPREAPMTFDPLFFAGLAIAIGGVALGIFIIRRTRRWVEKA